MPRLLVDDFGRPRGLPAPLVAELAFFELPINRRFAVTDLMVDLWDTPNNN